jgi:hypothetical protein
MKGGNKMMTFTFATVIGASGTLIASGVADTILRHYNKVDLAETLGTLTKLGAFTYGVLMAGKVIFYTAALFL